MNQLTRTTIALFMIVGGMYSTSAQLCTNDDRFTEVDYFQDSQIDTLLDLEYAQALDFNDSLNVLRLDIYMPDMALDSMAKRPFALQMFGGGFVAGNKTLMRGDCMALARKGFVCASIDYRLGDVAGGRAIYRAQQDAHAAMRWVVAHADTFGIDTSWLFAGGQSAGAITANYLHYASQADWSMIDPTLVDTLGRIDTSGNAFTNTFHLKGIINNWGSVRIADVSPHELIPMIAFHGEDDPIVPIDSISLGSGGSRWLHNKIVENGVCSDLTVAPGAGHSPPILFAPDFRMSKASCFFKSLFCESCSSVYTEDRIEADCSTTATSLSSGILVEMVQVFPNPSRSQTTIKYSLNQTEHVRLKIFDSTGRLVLTLVNAQQVAGDHEISWNGTDTLGRHQSAGTFFIRFETNRHFKSIPLIWLR